MAFFFHPFFVFLLTTILLSGWVSLYLVRSANSMLLKDQNIETVLNSQQNQAYVPNCRETAILSLTISGTLGPNRLSAWRNPDWSFSAVNPSKYEYCLAGCANWFAGISSPVG